MYSPHRFRMQNTQVRRIALALSCCLLAHCTPAQLFGQSALPSATAVATAGEKESNLAILSHGKKLETERRWQEAIQFYEKAVRKDPRFKECQDRLQISRVHFDVTRRYSDRSFMQTVDQSTPTDALQSLMEVVAKLDVYYVEPVDYYKLALHGTAFLEVALMEQDFLSKHLPNANAAAVEEFRRTIHKSVFGRKVSSAEDLKQAVATVANQASQKIGLMPTAVIYEYIAGAVGLLDPYSALLTVGEYREIMSQIEGNLIGLGVELWAEGTELRIVDVFKGGPAFDAGLQPNHHILEVDGNAVTQIGAKKAADLLRGPEGSRVRLVLKSQDEKLYDVDVVRKRVDVPSVSISEMTEPGIGFIKVTNFQKTTAAEVSRAMYDLSRNGMQSLIIDLRHNPGGLLDAAVEMADQFLARGSIVSTKGRNGQENHNFTATAPGTWDIPLVVLIDGDSASASEIFAGAIRDYDRGYVVGQTSYGKGSVQGVFHNENGKGGLRLTVSKFFSPKGTAISMRGIEPHVTVTETPTVADSPVAITALKPSLDTPVFVSKVDRKVDATKEKGIELARKMMVRQ